MLHRECAITLSPPRRPRQSYRHEAFFWHDDSDFAAALGAFVTDGLESGEPIMVAVIDEHAAWLRDCLGQDASEVHFVDMAELGRNPARIIPAWQRFLDVHSAHDRPARGVGEPIWVGRRSEEITECQLHEALLNVAIDPEVPFWLVCPYEAGGLGEPVLAGARHSHPVVLERGEYRGSPDYAGRAHVEAMFGTDLGEPVGEPIEIGFRADTLRRVFACTALEAYLTGVPADQAAELAAATQRLAEDSLRRGCLAGVVRIWQQPDALLIEVADQSRVDDPMSGRRLPDPGCTDGLWLANQLCDLVQLRSSGAGTAVRLHRWV